MDMRKLGVLFCCLLLQQLLVAQAEVKVYPTHWWAGMKQTKLQLLLQSKNIGEGQPKVTVSYPGVQLKKYYTLDNPNYLFLDLELGSSAKPGTFLIQISGKQKTKSIAYTLKRRNQEDGKTRAQGVTSKDLTYMLMPDRFSNGDPSNDAFKDYRDTTALRSNKFARHGGDLKGIENHFDYFKSLGVTTLWLTPVIENDMPLMRENGFDMAGYHGYWFTDHYAVDKRYGGNEGYQKFVEHAHQQGLKVIQDAIYNHVGLYHWMYVDPPAKDWINYWPKFTGPNHREEVLMDPYASKVDRENMLRGWFVPHLPDLNLANPLLSIFLVQHAIWTVEEFGIDGFRIDTYKYCDENFVNNVNAALIREFPQMTTFVEAWSNTITANAYFAQNNFQIPFKHNAMGAIDFSLCFAMHAGMNQPFGWTEGVNRIYMTLAQDLVYKNPLNNCIFLDNHDLDRVYSVIGEDWNKMKWGLNWLMTLRGIPQLFYGTEILIKNFKNPTDAEVRPDFPGGWAHDPVNKFEAVGRTALENEAFNYISKLAHFRKSSSALTTGKTMQYVIRDGVYVYFRYDDHQTVMVVTNTGAQDWKPDWQVYVERIKDFKKATNIISGDTQPLEKLLVRKGESVVLELK